MRDRESDRQEKQRKTREERRIMKQWKRKSGTKEDRKKENEIDREHEKKNNPIEKGT